MRATTSLIALLGLLHQALAAPNMQEMDKRALSNKCNQDNLYRAFIDPRYSSSASAFCSTYIRPTVTTTVMTTVSAGKAKRDFPATTYPPARLSSACSCILTATPSPATVLTTVVTTATATSTSASTATPSSTCSASTPVVKNGDFETGSLGPWALTMVTPPLPDYEQYLSVGVTSPGFGGSKYAFTVEDDIASSYVEIDLTQNVTVCAGSEYKFATQFYMTDAKAIPSPQTYVIVEVDGKRVAASQASDARGPPVVWLPLSGAFTAGSSTASLTVKFIATDYLTVKWGLDNVVVTQI